MHTHMVTCASMYMYMYSTHTHACIKVRVRMSKTINCHLLNMENTLQFLLTFITRIIISVNACKYAHTLKISIYVHGSVYHKSILINVQ